MGISDYSSLWRYWAPPLFWALAIMVMSGDFGSGSNTHYIFSWVLSKLTTLTPKTINLLHTRFRQSLHVICYGILSFLWFRALMVFNPERLGLNLILALVLSLMVASIDEGHQSLLTSRRGSLSDVGLDMVGATLFTFLAAFFWKRKKVPSEARVPLP